MKVKYCGTYGKVKFRGIVFMRGEIVEVPDGWEMPSNFETPGKPRKRPAKKLTGDDLRKMKKRLGWRKFQKWAHDKFGVKDTSREELYAEILKKQEGL